MQQGMSGPVSYGDLMYKFRRIVGISGFGDRFGGIVWRCIGVGCGLMSCSGLRAWFWAQSRFVAMVSSLVARRWVGPRAL